jgi:hypothetical protein
VSWPPKIGETLQRAAEAAGVREKLAGYSLNPEHDRGGVKARGFERILGITLEHIEYLEAQLRQAILATPITAVRDRSPYGYVCEIKIPIQGIGAKRDRTVEVTTAWVGDSPDSAPRLVNAYIRS